MQAWPILRLSREFAIVRLELDLRRRRVAVAGATVVARRLLTVLEPPNCTLAQLLKLQAGARSQDVR